jgi:hypothetical protein
MRALLPLLAALAACGSPEPPARAQAPSATPGSAAADPAFDARAWHRAAAAVDTSGGYEATWARMRALTDTLDRATGWKAACAREEGAPTFEPRGPSGVFALSPLADDEALVEVTCQFGAYQGSFALVRLDGPRATLVRGPRADDTGALTDTSAVHVGYLMVDPEARTFSVFAKSRGPGDCGVYSSYALDGDAARLTEVRARDCAEEIPDELPAPREWPVVYPRD